MSSRGGWTRRLDKLQAALPDPPAGSPYWHDSMQRLGYALRLGDREPDYAAAIEAYGELRPPYGEEAERLHEHLCELVGRAADKTPPCSAAEFAVLAAWLAAHGDSLPSAGWAKDIDVGDGVRVTLSDLTWRAARGPTAGSSGKLAETIRKLRAKYPDAATGTAAEGASGRPPPARRWRASVVRDDSEPPGRRGRRGRPGRGACDSTRPAAATARRTPPRVTGRSRYCGTPTGPSVPHAARSGEGVSRSESGGTTTPTPRPATRGEVGPLGGRADQSVASREPLRRGPGAGFGTARRLTRSPIPSPAATT